MENQELKELISKVEIGKATAEEKLKLIRELNIKVEEYNRVLKETLAFVPPDDK